MLYNKYRKFRTAENWETYRQQRNHVVKIKRLSICNYFFERCSGGPNSNNIGTDLDGEQNFSDHPSIAHIKQHIKPVADERSFTFGRVSDAQSTLLRLLEDWRQALDNHQCVGAILMDLSKSFDCIPHNLLLGKLQAYGLDEATINLISSYLSDRKQRIRLGPRLNRDFLQCDNFLVADISADNQRHLIFATEFQLRILRQAKQWFLDGTFKAVPPAFGSGQLFSIHAFVHINGKKKQFPLVFAIMSRRRKSDYVRVLTAVRDRLGDCQVEMCMLDFELAAWQALRDVFPEVTIRGCVFHLTQAWWRHIQDLGLARTYRERGATHNSLRMVLALPFLPPQQIRATFETVTARCPDDPDHPLRKFVHYIETNWIASTVHPLPPGQHLRHRLGQTTMWKVGITVSTGRPPFTRHCTFWSHCYRRKQQPSMPR
ncbi:uncharacterized protein [Argopecten irradians]|uniref:uncharacterized protein n=1 Tax=Argopecten irradians TaxID=31199 RepID=UPI003711DFF7